MIDTKNLIVVALIVASVAQAGIIKDQCEVMAKRLPQDEMLDSLEAMRMLDEQEQRLHAYTPTSYPRAIFSGWRIMLEQDCQSHSLGSMASMSWCEPAFPKAIIAQPLRAFADKCLNSELLHEKVEEMSADMHQVVKTNLIDAEFVVKFRANNPKIGPINFDNKTLDASKAIDAIVDAFKRDFSNTKTDAKALTKGNSAGLRNHINKKLIANCISNVKSGVGYAQQIDSVGKLWQGGVEAMIASLKPEAQLILFRYSFCNNIYSKSLFERQALVKQVEAKLQ